MIRVTAEEDIQMVLYAPCSQLGYCVVIGTGDDTGEFFLASRYSGVRSRTCHQVDETGVRETVVMPCFVDE